MRRKTLEDQAFQTRMQVRDQERMQANVTRFANEAWQRASTNLAPSIVQMDGYKTLGENQKVEFEIADGPKGKQAEKVRIV